ncbi:RM28 protein, partial [Pseudoatta argentina]
MIASIFRNSLCLEVFNRPIILELTDVFRVPEHPLVSTAGFLISTKVAESSVRVVVHEEIAVSRLFVTRYRHRSECHVQNIPIPVVYPKEINDGIWGGEAIVKGFKKKGIFKRRVPHFWIPSLFKSVIYSEVLDTYMRIVITQRALRLIHENYGFDHYLLKTPACDLRSLLALKLKRQILIALADKTLYPNDPKKHTEVYAKYEQYLSAYTRKEIEWYGLTYEEACKKWMQLNVKQSQPLKIQYRSELIAKLKENKIKEVENVNVVSPEETSSWLNKLNPFSKSSKTQ